MGIAGLAAGLDWIAERGIGSILDHERGLAEKLVAGCARMGKVNVHGGGTAGRGILGPDQLPVISVTVDERSPEEIGLFLDTDWNIAARTGLQCAPLAHKALGTAAGGSVRFSFGPFNSDQDVDAVLKALRHLAK